MFTYSHTLRVACAVILEQSVPYGMHRIKFRLKAPACALVHALLLSHPFLASPPAHPLPVSRALSFCSPPLSWKTPPSSGPPAGVTNGPAPLPFPWSRSFSLLFTPCLLSIPSLCATLPFPFSSVPPPPGVAQPSPPLFGIPGLIRPPLPSSLPLSPLGHPSLLARIYISQDLFVVTES